MNARRTSFLGVLVALALALHLLEGQIPSPLPWVRPGLANLMTLIALLAAGWRAALLVTLLRVGIGSLLLGGFLGPSFVLSLAGGVASTLVMAALAPGAWRLWSPLAVSAAGAVAHGAAQVLVLTVVLLRSADLPWLLPWVLVPSLAAGIATGLLANLVLLRWQGYFRAVA
ncbi:MAG TPA: Gx transporter family protein [Candidatus Methanoperedens sp.]|nr:Gx transporter family protein [Candidatus Methanoperedens sp.]